MNFELNKVNFEMRMTCGYKFHARYFVRYTAEETLVFKEYANVISSTILKIKFLILIVVIFISCSNKQEIDQNNVDILLSGWNGKIGIEDNIISLKSNRSFTFQTSASYVDSCGVLTEFDYNEIVTELNEMLILSFNLYHTQSCSDADGNKQTTKLIVTYLETKESNTIRWSECQNDPDNLDIMMSLDSFRDFMRGIINRTGKNACD